MTTSTTSADHRAAKAAGPSSQANRTATRRLLVQMLYQWQLTQHDLADLLEAAVANPHTAETYAKADQDYFRDVLRSVIQDTAKLKAGLDPLLDRPLIQLDPIERSILYMGACELSEHMNVPYKVVINEAVELAKQFGAEQSHKFINGVLDRFAQQARAFETQAEAVAKSERSKRETTKRKLNKAKQTGKTKAKPRQAR